MTRGAGDRADVAGRAGTGRDAAPGAPGPTPHVVLLTGLSGGGKTAAAKLFEDLGYAVMDNLPAELLGDLARLVATEPDRFARAAIVVDVRAGDAERAFAAVVSGLRDHAIRPQVFFLEARDDVLIRRFSETRHRHPLEDGRSIAAAIALERRLLDPLRRASDEVVDTSDLALRQLRERIFSRLGELEPGAMAVQLVTFGYKFGIPLEADLVFDARFIANPYYIPELRELTGLAEPVREHVLRQQAARTFLRRVEALLDFAIPAYEAEGKSRLTVAIGCTGGQHRSVVLAEALAEWLRDHGRAPVVFHRELDAR
jgi:UPF0042 nucleotide-binding protein